ncbi:MAG: nuclear transport factor 2 family protein [Sphingobium sp.]
MTTDGKALDTLIAKDAIRELAMLYSRGVDRKDGDLLRTLYTEDATDTHGDSFDGGKEAYVDFLEKSFPYMRYSGHHICNHLISVDGDAGDGEVYAIAWHIIPDGKGGWIEDVMCCRYIDNYRREADGRWRFSKRVVTYDMRTQRPHVPHKEAVEALADESYAALASRLFQRGPRA